MEVSAKEYYLYESSPEIFPFKEYKENPIIFESLIKYYHVSIEHLSSSMYKRKAPKTLTLYEMQKRLEKLENEIIMLQKQYSSNIKYATLYSMLFATSTISAIISAFSLSLIYAIPFLGPIIVSLWGLLNLFKSK